MSILDNALEATSILVCADSSAILQPSADPLQDPLDLNEDANSLLPDDFSSPDLPDEPHEDSCAAHAMTPEQRRDLALDALCRRHSISYLARTHGVSRKFVSSLRDKAHPST